MAEHDGHAEHQDDPAGRVAPTPGPTPAEPYTVHADTDTGSGAAEPARPARVGPDPVALVAGLTALLVAVLALTDVLSGIDPRWALAAVAIGVGGAVLLSSRRRRGA